MVQNNTVLNIIDNSGAKIVECIKVYSGYKRRYAYVGDTILVTVKSLRSKRRGISKIKKGELYRALIIRTKFKKLLSTGDSISFKENSAILLTKQNKFVGTRVFGSVPKIFKKTKFFKLITLSSGLIV
jgi:large subunit ribosomal protein L14